MRLVAFNDLKPNMIIADDFYGIRGEILAKKDTVITERYITGLAKYEIPFLYVFDEPGEGIEVKCNITSGTRNDATQNLKKLYEAIKANQSASYSKLLDPCKKSVERIVEDVIAEKIDLYDVFDIKLIENYRYQQPVNVLLISTIIGKALGLGYMELYEMGMAAYFHDIGNLFIDEEVLNKFDKLTDEEYRLIQKHAELGYKFAKEKLMLPMKTYLAIGQHHERFDGTGYPYKKVGEDINRYARIIAIADVYDALSSRRRQRTALNPAQAFKVIIEGAGSHFDPKFVRTFFGIVSPYPIGYTIKLPDTKMGVVIENYHGKPFNPMIKVFSEQGVTLKNPYELILE